jgi:TonB-dependent receptor-like protein
VVGAILQTPLAAQVPQPDSTRRDTLVVPIPARPDTAVDADSTRGTTRGTSQPSKAPPPDTIKAPLARAESPPLLDISQPYRWNREELFASGAVTLADLLDRVPGATGLRAGWLTSPMVTGYLGDLTRVRVFYDGLELDALDPTLGGELDLGQIQLWTLEEVAIERGAAELRVYLRSWRVDRTTPYTRTDIATGDEETNLYRGFFGKRLRHGEAFQLAGQQFGTTAPFRTGGGGDGLSILSRLGWARRRWSVDGFMLRSSRTRDPRSSALTDFTITRRDGRQTDAYVRAAYGDPNAGPWAQLVAASLSLKADSGVATSAVGTTPAATVPRLVRSRAEYVAAGGLSKWGLRLSATDRLRVFEGRTVNTPSARIAFDRRWLAVSLFGEGEGLDSVARLEASARIAPLRFLALSGSVARLRDTRSGAPEGGTYARGEAGVRVAGRLWLSGGVLMRDAVTLVPAIVFDTGFAPVTEERKFGTFVSIRGPVWKVFNADITGTMWDTAGVHRPRFQTRSELYIATQLRKKFPSGNFGLLASVRHEYRSPVYFQQSDRELVRANSSRVLTSLLEIRIVSAVLFFQMRNFMRAQYELVPGYEMPIQMQLYGVRWDFWN